MEQKYEIQAYYGSNQGWENCVKRMGEPVQFTKEEVQIAYDAMYKSSLLNYRINPKLEVKNED